MVDSVTEVEQCGILTHLHDSIIVGRKEIELRHRRISQIKRISHLTKIGRYGHRHHGVPLVASALLVLRNLFTGSQRIGERTLNQFPDITVSHSIIEIIDYIVHHVIILCQNANGQVRRQADKIPVGPIVVAALSCVIFQEIEILFGKYIQHPLFEVRLILIRPVSVSLHNLGCIGKSIALRTGRQYLIGVIGSNALAFVRPVVHHLNGSIGIIRVSGQFPQQSHLVSRRGIAHGIRIVFTLHSRTRRVSSDNPFRRRCHIGSRSVSTRL